VAEALQRQIDALVQGKPQPGATGPPRSLRAFVQEGMAQEARAARSPRRKRVKKQAPKRRKRK